MSSKKPRQRKPVHFNTMQRAAESAGKLPPQSREKLKAAATVALDCIRKGDSPREAWARLADALNVAEALADLGICSDDASRERIRAGFAALESLLDRKEERGTWTATAAELTALREAVWLHGVQLDHVSLGEMERAVARIKARIAQVRAGNVPKGVTVREAK